jgi:hypothetical protein
MSVYEISPHTTLLGNDLPDSVRSLRQKHCRAWCDSREDCEAFVWKLSQGKDTCYLKGSSQGGRAVDDTATLYVKNGNHNYWVLWLFLAVVTVIVFKSLCRMK